jgi:hypothetical protein
MIALLTINNNINVYYHLRYEWIPAIDTTLRNQICQWFPVRSFIREIQFPPTLSDIPDILFYSGVKHQMLTKTHIPWWVVSFSSCTLLSSILTAFSSSMILSSCVFSVMLEIDLELTDSNGIVNIQNVYTMCVLDIFLYAILCIL